MKSEMKKMKGDAEDLKYHYKNVYSTQIRAGELMKNLGQNLVSLTDRKTIHLNRPERLTIEVNDSKRRAGKIPLIYVTGSSKSKKRTRNAKSKAHENTKTITLGEYFKTEVNAPKLGMFKLPANPKITFGKKSPFSLGGLDKLKNKLKFKPSTSRNGK